MTDLWFSEEGDIAVSANGDLAMTERQWRDDVQQVYIRMMTDVSDYVLYPLLGADLSQLYGKPQSADTGQLGVTLIDAALKREGRFTGQQISVQAIPTDYDKIRFDAFVTLGSREKIRMSVEQDLGVV